MLKGEKMCRLEFRILNITCSYLVAFKPSIWISSSALKRRLASCSVSEPRLAHRASISSLNMVLGAWNRAYSHVNRYVWDVNDIIQSNHCIQILSLTISNNKRTNFSLSPRYFEVSVLDDTLKNVVPHSVATALANIVLPVPANTRQLHKITTFCGYHSFGYAYPVVQPLRFPSMVGGYPWKIPAL